MLAHFFKDIAVANLRADEAQILALKIAFKAKVRHHCRNDTPASKFAAAAHSAAKQRHDLVAIDHAAMFVHNDKPVCIAIKSDTNIRASSHHGFLQRCDMRRSDLVVDILAIWFDANRRHFRAKLPNRSRRYLVSGPVGAI